ncbi:hypothetical protein Q9L58_006967 [Maublancomyces gigas]|uniref:IRG-type G domain-containing protein n=1 Tax=Discina gigas TaxID=1032678 RepID=A0ABR3GE52_9PEZI
MDFVSGVVAAIVQSIVSLFSLGPEVENETVRDIEEHHTRENSLSRIGEELDEHRRVRNWRRQTRQSAAAEERTSILGTGWHERPGEERAMRKIEERVRVLEMESEERLRKQQKEREEQKTKQDLEREAIRNEQKRLVEEEKRIAERERELETWIQQARDRISEEQEIAATMGFQPSQWPTPGELDAAKQRVQYSRRNFHFAIVGKAGCGKSSLINSFLNLKATDPGAAPTGTIETTLEIGRYPDPGTQPPRPWTVWYDIPGAGTQRIPHWQYFTNQALYVFDIIILAIGERFEETDCQIIRSCIEFKIPFFIVRSKADHSIMNMMSDADEDYRGPFDSGEFYQKCRQSFRELTQKSVSVELDRAGLPDQVVYCVSKRALRDVYNSSLEASIQPDDVSHEMALVKQLMLAAYLRRSGRDRTSVLSGTGIRQTTTGWAQSAYLVASDIAESTIGLGSAGLNALRLAGSNNVHQERQPNREQISGSKRVIYLPRRTTVVELLSELNSCNPGISNVLAARPVMMGPKAAIICFHPTASIPSNILAFGKTQKPTMYKERTPTGRAPTTASRVSTSADTPPGSIDTTPSSRFSRAGQWGPRR